MVFKKIISIFILGIIFSTQCCNEIASIKELLEFIPQNKNVLVVFDIDNTLLCPDTDLGSDQWFSSELSIRMKQGKELVAAVDDILPVYIHIQRYAHIIPTESSLEHDILHIQSIAHSTMCLTARSSGLIDITLNQLAASGLNFPQPHWMKNFPLQPYDHAGHLAEGIIFVGNNDKGSCLLAYLNHHGHQPDMVIFVDDKFSNVRSVVSALETSGIPSIGLRYAGCDKRVEAFNHAETEAELKALLYHHPLMNH